MVRVKGEGFIGFRVKGEGFIEFRVKGVGFRISGFGNQGFK